MATTCRPSGGTDQRPARNRWPRRSISHACLFWQFCLSSLARPRVSLTRRLRPVSPPTPPTPVSASAGPAAALSGVVPTRPPSVPRTVPGQLPLFEFVLPHSQISVVHSVQSLSMLSSISGSIRSAVRHARRGWPSPLAPATAVRQNSSSAPPGNPPASSFGEVTDMFRSAGDALQSELQSGSRPAFTYDYDSIDTNLVSDAPDLRGFRSGRLLSPYQYSRKERTKTQRRAARSLLGPNAKESRELDYFHQLEINPLHECTNSSLLSNFVTEMGKIRSRAETQLTWKTQRRLGKAIRRAKMMGIIPVLSKRPLNLINEHGIY
ncbi:uncharacterized protein FIBRA_01450 [Fibroporia radiculosa]|uniref:Small ribosomal subunit protein bS18m n=1 Tax=Fibroporia radiculosa TaxID=599839 RepID=J4HTD2_9APHY|nr:uncharacterized protein FIBRA_01450 [Fibroporia radiculosa]CCL99432.1 predicted protein [Fibroporia radiculosa]